MIEPQKKKKPANLQKIQEEEIEESLSRSARSISIDESQAFFEQNNLSNI